MGLPLSRLYSQQLSIKSLFDFDFKKEYKIEIASFEKESLVVVNDNLTLTTKGKLVADSLTEAFAID